MQSVRYRDLVSTSIQPEAAREYWLKMCWMFCKCLNVRPSLEHQYYSHVVALCPRVVDRGPDFQRQEPYARYSANSNWRMGEILLRIPGIFPRRAKDASINACFCSSVALALVLNRTNDRQQQEPVKAVRRSHTCTYYRHSGWIVSSVWWGFLL